MDTILHNSKVWLTADGRLEVYDNRIANKLNAYLKTYDTGVYLFKQHEEAVFKIAPDQIQTILLTFLTKGSTQTGEST